MAENTEPSINEEAPGPAASDARAPSNLPLIITLCALLIYFGFQTLSLLTERANLSLVRGSQESALQEAQKIQTQFKTLVTKTSELADKGHTGAKMVIEGLQRQGVGDAPAEASPPAPDAKAAK